MINAPLPAFSFAAIFGEIELEKKRRREKLYGRWREEGRKSILAGNLIFALDLKYRSVLVRAEIEIGAYNPSAPIPRLSIDLIGIGCREGRARLVFEKSIPFRNIEILSRNV